MKKYIVSGLMCAMVLINVPVNATEKEQSFKEYVVAEFENIDNKMIVGEFNSGLASIYTDNTNYNAYLPSLELESGFIDKNGVITIPQIYTRVGDFEGGVAVAVKQVGSTNKTGVIDTNNNVILPFEYDYVAPFNDGYTYVGKTGNIDADTFDYTYGYINDEGEFVTPIIYKSAGVYAEGMATVSLDTKGSENFKSYFINMDNQRVLGETSNFYNYFSDGMCGFALDGNSNGPYGYVNTSGEIVVEPIYASVTNFDGGYATVRDYDGKYYVINKSGEQVFSPNVIMLDAVLNGLVLGKTYDNNYVFYNMLGELVLELDYDVVGRFNEGLSLVGRDTNKDGEVDKYGYIDINGTEVLELNFDSGTNFSEELATVLFEGVYYIIENPIVEKTEYKEIIKNESPVYINSREVDFEAYTIDSNNYFKLRDIAYAISGEKNNFDVSWNDELKSIEIETQKTYTVVGGELEKSEETPKYATSTASKIYIDGEEVLVTAYTIDGYNYVKLRDILRLLDIQVVWDQMSKTISIHTGLSYTE